MLNDAMKKEIEELALKIDENFYLKDTIIYC